MIDFFAEAEEKVLAHLDVDARNGLSPAEVAKRLNHYGPNILEQKAERPWWKLLLAQFRSPLVALLLVAMGLSFFFKEWLDGIAILIVLIINAVIGFLMEFQAGRAMEALKKLSSLSARVLREGRMQVVPIEEIVPGDLLYLETGDIVSADARIIRQSQLQADESSLTGESVPVDKINSALAAATTLADRKNMLYRGTFISKGNAFAVVTDTGMKTELGKIANLVQGSKESGTPLEKKLEEFGNQIVKITVVLVIIIFLVGWLSGREFLIMLQTSIALAVAAIPEGLPIVATIGLANGMMKMARKNVIIRRLSAVETLGGTSVICTDKTGTLTENKMTVAEFTDTLVLHPRILEACVLCSTAELSHDGSELGDPLEIALLKYVESELRIKELREQYPKIKEHPFSSETKRMATAHQHGNSILTFAKGAAEEMVRLSTHALENNAATTLTDHTRQALLQNADHLASKGYKVIGFAYAEHTSLPEDLFSSLTFLGFISLIDPPRENIQQAIEECRAAGIQVVMVTGDHISTANEIALQVGIQTNSGYQAINGAAMKSYDDLSESEKKTWCQTSVFARVSPAQKLDLVKVFQESGQVVGMTGDGVNDAPALKKADIGIAMGMRGTQVAQEVADMVLKDDSFASIVAAIREGRIIFENIRKFVIYLLSSNLSELFIIATASIMNLWFQLVPLQILFINLITDVLPALALGMTQGDPSIMQRTPRKITEPIIDRTRWKAIFVYATVNTIFSLLAVFIAHEVLNHQTTESHSECNNILFFTIITIQLFHTFNMNSSGSGFFTSDVFRNKFVWYAIAICILVMAALYAVPTVRAILSVGVITLVDLVIILGSSLASVIVIQVLKYVKLIRQ